MNIKIGILREEKTPPDRRVPFTPEQVAEIIATYSTVKVVVQPSEIRCFKDEDYVAKGVVLQEDLSDCDIIFGVKEVPVQNLIPNKRYFFFSHTHKLQPYNKKLIQAILENKITHTDYECLVQPNGARIIGFGRYAGIVGAYNGLKTFGERTRNYQLKPATSCTDLQDMIAQLKLLQLNKVKIVLTGSGRVAKGANEILEAAKIRKVATDEYLTQTFNEAVYCWIDADEYTERKDGADFDFNHFFENGTAYKSTFKRFTEVSDLFIAGHYWDNSSPVFFTKEQAASEDFKIRVIADISCDIACAVPSTLRPSTIADPVYDYDRITGKEVEKYSNENNISVMAVDNLPCELPVDASQGFGKLLIEQIVPLLVYGDKDDILKKATFTTSEGKLASKYSYMETFVNS
ncbi:NAD(P)-dependent oxidoreductase [Tenacibaculum pacificus]|uniref:NAD(P)-dependent oxidoreductase n=1 Tax=Tenacibaculum pacificus TaxID=3018314 RepID=UPI0022F3C817|nr:NAD(P)-dependent oxidoreductase [Tenacibaculum pacificus]WBX74336.1 NAD(P)-dependent oxidoreductase [Tenacibaculum pacificus]